MSVDELPASDLTIGDLAKAAGVNVETVRYYQRRGLLTAPPRPVAGYRRYAALEVGRLRFVKRAQMLGFTLGEIADLMRLADDSAREQARELAARKLSLIQRKMADLAAMQRALGALLCQCEASDSPGTCPIIEALSRD
jgi:MerR family mercuric resistance operon transcriptional regulator